MVLQADTLYVYFPVKAALVLQVCAVTAPAPMVAVTLPPKLKCTVNRAVVFPLMTLHIGHAAASIAGQRQILVWTDAGSTA